MDLAINATFVCDIDGTDISMCSSITGPLVPPSAPEADIIRSGSVAYTGPGCLYSDPNNVLFIDIDQICNIIESNRPNFPTIIPPVEIMVTSRAMPDRLALNIDDTNAPDNVADTEDDIIDLTGSTSRTFASSDFSLTYRDNVVTVRRGPRVVNTIENIGEFNALLQVSSPRGTRLRLTRASGSSNSFFPGPGQLVTGTNTRTGAGAAFFTDSSEVSRNINRDIVNSQLRCTIVNGVPTIQRVSDNQELTSLSGVESLTFPSATSKAKGTSMVTISDTSGPIRTFICDTGISLACFVNNQATFFSPTMTGNVSVDSGGLSVLYDEESCNVFAYPTTNTLISTLIQNCTSRATVTPAPPIRFGVERDAFGTSVFTADGAPILQPSSSRSDLVGGNEVIDYSRDSGRLTIRGREGDRAIYNGIRQFAVNTASNRLQISGSRNIINGPGNLFVDDTGQSFFTTSDSLASFIQSSATGPSRQVSVVGTVDNGATSVNLQIGNRNIFNLGPDTTERPIQDDESLIYSGNRLFTVNAMRIPSDNRVNYFPGMNLVQIVRECTGEVIRERSMSSLFSPMVRGDVPVIQSNNISLPGGGVFYRGTGGDVYLPDDSIYTGAIDVLYNIVMAMTTINDDMGNPADVTSLGFYNSDGSVYQVFNGSSPRTLFGPGSIYTSCGSYFYTNNRGLRQDIRSGNSRLRPPLIAFNVCFSTNSGEFITNFPGDSELIDVPRGTVVYSGGNITINDFVFRTDIDSLTYFDGLQVQMFNASTQTEPTIFPGPGSLLINGKRAIYSSDSLISSRIRGALNEARCFFLPPNIPSSFPSFFISNLSQVEVGFGQEVTVYEGANVDLRCTAGNANPPATIDFIRNDCGPLEQGGNVMFIDNGVNDVTLRLLDISTDQNDVTYTCRASNSFGTTSKSTRLKVRPSGK